MDREGLCCGVSFDAARWRSFFAQLSPCTVGVEACGSAHHWARVIGRYGHQVRLMPPAYVKPYVKRNKNDGRDAEAICEAVSRNLLLIANGCPGFLFPGGVELCPAFSPHCSQ